MLPLDPISSSYPGYEIGTPDIVLAVLLSYLLLQVLPWFLRRFFPNFAAKISEKLKTKLISKEELKQKHSVIVWVVGIGLFALAIMIAREFLYRNLFIMAADLMISLAWLMLAIFVSLLIRLKGNQLSSGIKLYLPFISMAFVVILFRIVLIPNSLVNLIYPPLSLIFVIWQIRQQKVAKDSGQALPLSDSLYSNVSLLTMVVGCVLSWIGILLLRVATILFLGYCMMIIVAFGIYSLFLRFLRQIVVDDTKGMYRETKNNFECIIAMISGGKDNGNGILVGDERSLTRIIVGGIFKVPLRVWAILVDAYVLMVLCGFLIITVFFKELRKGTCDAIKELGSRIGTHLKFITYVFLNEYPDFDIEGDYIEERHLKKDGTPDRRYRENK